jgi:Periplasmic protein TonB, links inner and outer membranes
MKGKAIIAAAVVLLLLFTACSHGPETPAGISSETVTPSTALVDPEPATEFVSPTIVTTETVTTMHAETEPALVETEAPAESSSPVETKAAVEETQKSTEPRPTEPQPTEPRPTTPTPTPTEPKPTEPKPTEPQKPTEPAHVHSYKTKVVAPSCTSKGYTEHRCSCGDSYKDSYTDALGHSFTEQSVAATCTGGGYTRRTCSRCGATETTNTTPTLGHDYRDTVVPPTTSSEGYTEHKCSRCGDTYRDNYTEKLHEVFDLQAVIDYGCAYAQSLGFTIDRSMTLANSGYYPGYYGKGYSMDFLKREVAENVQYTADMLTADGDTIDGYRCYIHASYEPDTDMYYIVVLYG